MASVDLFVPGRLCILGEHTDWAANYIEENPDVGDGYTLVCATNEGMSATVSLADDGQFHFIRLNSEGSASESFSAAFDVDHLRSYASEGGFWSYIAGSVIATVTFVKKEIAAAEGHLTAIQVDQLQKALETWFRRGVVVRNTSTTLPMKKGLSSSAAVCVLTVLASLHAFQLSLPHPISTEIDAMMTQWQSAGHVMAMAYEGETLTPSRCGRMDQCVVMGRDQIALMHFTRAQAVTLQPLKLCCPLYFVVCDLKGEKDTVAILRDLHSVFPFPQTETQRGFLTYISDIQRIAHQGVQAIETGDVLSFADCLSEAQRCFNQFVAPNAPSSLRSPKLHAFLDLLDDIRSGKQQLAGLEPGDVLAAKGVGSQGDGCAQLLCRDAEAQQRVITFLREGRGLDAFALSLPPHQDR